MASIRKRNVKRNGKAYRYWVVDYSYKQDGETRRKQKHFSDKTEAELFKAEIERDLARARYADLPVEMGPPDVSITEWVDRFAKAVKPNCSDDYFDIIRYTLTQFREFLRNAGVMGTGDLQREHLAAYIEHEFGRDLKPKSVANNAQIVKRAVKWGAQEGLLDSKLAQGFPSVKVPKNTRRILSKPEIEKVLEAFSEDPLYPVVLTALYTGIRRGELVQLHCEHVDLEGGVIELPGDITKNDNPRSIGIHERLQPVLEKLVGDRDGPVFTRRGEPLKPDYVSRHFSLVLNKIGDAAEARDEKRPPWTDITFHVLRHTCATRLAAGGMSPFNVQRVMGHADIKTTMIYVNLAEERVPDMSVL